MAHNISEWYSGLSQEERIECSRKAGKASAAVRRQHKQFRDVFRDILSLDVTDEKVAQALEELGLDPSFANAIGLQAILKAATTGDIEAARFARDTIGEKPTEAFQLGITDKPIKSMDLSKLSDEELAALADRAEE
jgi:hypothetical protein